MTDESVRPTPRPRSDDPLARDLDALSNETARDLPILNQTVAAARERKHNSQTEGFFVTTIQFMKRRPWAAAAAVMVLALLILSIVPISYDRTVGHDVVLQFSAPGATSNDVAQVAKEFKSIVGAEAVNVAATSENGSMSYAMNARVPASGLAASRVFAKSLETRGYKAELTSTPVVERVSSPMIAYAAGQVIEIAVDGKSDAELQNEITQKLLDAGLRDVSVQVTTSGDRREVRINAEQTAEGAEAGGAIESPEVVLTKEGQPIAGDKEVKKLNVKMGKTAEADGSLTLTVTVSDGTQTATATVRNSDTKSKADQASEIESQLRAAGMNVQVSADGERLKVTESNQ